MEFIVTIQEPEVQVITVASQGEQGIAGLIWIDAGWSSGVDYIVDNALEHNGSSYRAFVAHTSSAATEPGVGVDWETVWKILAQEGVPGTTVHNDTTGKQGGGSGEFYHLLLSELNGLKFLIAQFTILVIDLLTATCTRDTTRTLLALPADGVVADGLSIIMVEIDEVAITGGRRISEGIWSSQDADGVSLTNSLSVAAAGTNKCTCVKANPTDTTNVSLTGGGSLSIVDDLTELSLQGFSEVCNGNVYKLSVPFGEAEGFVTISGVTANINIHSFSAVIRSVGDGLVRMSLTGSEGIITVVNNAEYIRKTSDNITPGSTTRELRIRAASGSSGTDVYFILPQLEESTASTPVIIGADTAASASRDADINTTPTPTVILGEEWAFEYRFTPAASGLTGTVMASYTDANNYTEVSINTNSIILRKRVGGVNHDATFAYTHVGGTEAWFQIFGGATGTGIRASHASADITLQSFDTDADTDLAVWASLIGWGHLNGGNVIQQEVTNNGYPIARLSKDSAGWS